MKQLFILSVCIIFLMYPTTNLSCQTIITKCVTGDWVFTATGTNPVPAYEFIEDANPPMGEGCLKLKIGTLPSPAMRVNTFMRCRNSQLAGTLLTDISQLSYHAKIVQWAPGSTDAPYLRIDIEADTNSDGTSERFPILYNPKYQGNGPQLNQWQLWEAHAGKWWIGPAPVVPDPDNGGPLYTFNQLKNKLTGAKVYNPTNQGNTLGGFSLQIGSSTEVLATWSEFEANIDKLTLTIGGTNKIFDFEASLRSAGEDIYCRKFKGKIGKPAVAGHSYSWTSIPAGFTSTEANPSVSVHLASKKFILEEKIDATGCVMIDAVTVNIRKNAPNCKKDPLVNRWWKWPAILFITGLIIWIVVRTGNRQSR